MNVLRVATVLLACCATARADELTKAARQVTQIVAHRGASTERPECTLSAVNRAIEVGATAIEVDVRTSKDGVLFILHDTTLNRTTNGKGPASALTIAELKQLDAGSWFDPRYRDERIPTLREALTACRGGADILLDLKEQGAEYAQAVADEVVQFGDPRRTVVGVRSVEQARLFRRLLPDARQLGLIPNQQSIEAFAAAGVKTIRIWPRWLAEDGGDQLIARVRAAKAQLHLNGTEGKLDETRELLAHGPASLSSDDPGRLVKTLRELGGQ